MTKANPFITETQAARFRGLNRLDLFNTIEREWLIQEFIESELEINDGDCEPHLIRVGLDEMTDQELICECVDQMPNIIQDFEQKFGGTLMEA
jgi:hypothetical protein